MVLRKRKKGCKGDYSFFWIDGRVVYWEIRFCVIFFLVSCWISDKFFFFRKFVFSFVEWGFFIRCFLSFFVILILVGIFGRK